MKIFSSTVYMKCYNIILISIFIISGFATNAQTNYPYSRIGIGDLINTNNVYNLGMGGVSLANATSSNINYNNPASYSKIGLSTIQIATRANRSNLNNGNNIDIATGSFDIHYLNLALPINKKTGMSFGLMPISKVYYLLKDELINFDSTITYNLSGGGGNFQNIYMGIGHQVKNFSIGANIFYTFGSKNIKTINTFADSLSILSTEFQNNLSGGGIGATAGSQYLIKLAKNRELRFGATFSPSYRLKTTTDKRYVSMYNGAERDTALVISDIAGKIKMPMSYGVGMQAKLSEKLNAGLDYTATQWSKYNADGNTDSLTDTKRIALGFNYIPDANALLNYWKHVEYRLGFYTGNEFVKLQNTVLPLRALTAGLSLPLRRTRDSQGFLHTSFEFGSRGTTTNNLIRDNFSRFNVGLTLNAKWFIPTKYE